MSNTAIVTPEDVLTFWFGPPDRTSPLANSSKWYKKDASFDREVEHRFSTTLELAAHGELEGWKATPSGRLALVIVLDQLSRNIYRDRPRAFAHDALARSSALEAMAAGDERSMDTVERTFLYMPLMHAEDVDFQRQCVAKFEKLHEEASPELRPYVENGLSYARRHAEIVERFGRFPHRNAILGRVSTPEEIDFLKEPGSSF